MKEEGTVKHVVVTLKITGRNVMEPEKWTLVQFCPCGHTRNVLKTRVAKQLVRARLDAPILSSSECPECDEDRQRQDAAEARDSGSPVTFVTEEFVQVTVSHA